MALDIDVDYENYNDKSTVLGKPDKFYFWALEVDKTAMAEAIRAGYAISKDPDIITPYAEKELDENKNIKCYVRKEFYERLVLMETSMDNAKRREEKEAEKREERMNTPVPEARDMVNQKKKLMKKRIK